MIPKPFWTRVEPTAKATTPDVTLRARVHDPLWFLTRQWQVGELRGEDAASPIHARVDVEVQRISRFLVGSRSGHGQPFDARQAPLEARAERHPVRLGPGEAARAGQHLLRTLRAHGLDSLVPTVLTHHPLPDPGADPAVADHPDTVAATRRHHALLAGKVPDGAAAYAALRDGTAAWGAPAGMEAAHQQAITTWTGWFEATYAPGAEDTWDPERMEHAFCVGVRTSTGEVTLCAPEHQRDRLDWFSFDHAPDVTTGARQDPAPRTVNADAIPAPVQYRGMPADRWWEMENAAVNLDAIESQPQDLARMVLLDFAMMYSNDWFLVPVELPVGCIALVRSLTVTDVFGQSTAVQAASTGDHWRAFELTRDGGGSTPGLFLAPTMAGALRGEPVEEVHLLHDEEANLAWAVEALVEGPLGEAIDRHAGEVRREAEQEPGTPAADAGLRYHLASRVPRHWIPLVPVRRDDGVVLRRGTILDEETGQPVRAVGTLLRPDQKLYVRREEVPREGARVQRAWQACRWSDGASHAWVGRSKVPHRPTRGSGLRYDALQHEAP